MPPTACRMAILLLGSDQEFSHRFIPLVPRFAAVVKKNLRCVVVIVRVMIRRAFVRKIVNGTNQHRICLGNASENSHQIAYGRHGWSSFPNSISKHEPAYVFPADKQIDPAYRVGGDIQFGANSTFQRHHLPAHNR